MNYVFPLTNNNSLFFHIFLSLALHFLNHTWGIHICKFEFTLKRWSYCYIILRVPSSFKKKIWIKFFIYSSQLYRVHWINVYMKSRTSKNMWFDLYALFPAFSKGATVDRLHMFYTLYSTRTSNLASVNNGSWLYFNTSA